ncbi:MAG: LytTR family transcriptional regulator [Cytophagales bacterium]|nr:MAG: LytTR family transcriptional regulator [Cytophagales bacterium]
MELLDYTTKAAYAPRQQPVFIRVNDPLIGWQSRPIRDLIMVRGDNGYSWLYWKDGSRHIAAYPVKHYESKLPESQYIRVHQNSIVNLDFIQKLHLTHKGPQISLTTGDKLPVSRRRWGFVKENLRHLL